MSKEIKYELRYSHNIIEHLGLKLYQNKPTNVIAELVSNSWDADAEAVRIEARTATSDNMPFISVEDNGIGMSPEQLNGRYLVIGLPKRDIPAALSESKRRPLMGRKGIGKLAPFGIAQEVDIVTASKGAPGKYTWIRIDLSRLLVEAGGDPENPLQGRSYQPLVFGEKANPDALPLDSDSTGAVQEFITRTSQGSGHGTLILLSRLSVRRAISTDQLKESMGRRFTVTLTRPDFTVYINGEAVTDSVALPSFGLRIPSDQGSWQTEEINGKPLRFWVGFVEKADWPQDQAGVGVYTHGKIAQDRPFLFGAKGVEIFARYMYGVVEADWLDEGGEDIVSTDRTSLNWESDLAQPLYEWGRNKVRTWAREYERWRKHRDNDDNRDRLKKRIEEGKAPKVTESEQEQIVELLSNVTPRIGRNDAVRDQLVLAVTEAWLQKPMRRLLRDLWQSLETGMSDTNSYLTVVSQLAEHTVPESLGLAVTFAQRAYALRALYMRVNHGTETDLQKLIERFPWIIAPDKQFLTANKTLKAVVDEAVSRGLLPQGVHGKSPDTVMEGKRPDFIYLSTTEDRLILVVELKNPGEALTEDNKLQLYRYIMHLKQRFPDSEIRGILVGNGSVDDDIRIIDTLTWDAILRRSYAQHVDLLAAMLSASAEAGDDERIRQVREFGGQATWELLERMSRHDERLRDLMETFEPS